jgi:Tfp pilus assembly protein PilP
MKLTIGIVALALTAGTAWGQNSATPQKSQSAAQPTSAATAHSKPSAAQAQTGPKPAVISISPVAMPAKPAAPPAKTATTTAKPAVVPAKAATTKPVIAPATAATTTAKPALVPAKTNPAKPVIVPAKAAPISAKPEVKAVPTKTAATPATKASVPAQTKAAPTQTSTKPSVKIAATPTPSKGTNAASGEQETAKNEKPEDKKYSMTGKRDPFISPVVNRSGGSGCSTGKKCLDIEQIALHGVVKSDNGMIAVVTNGLNKAYFLRENDPVFNGYVVKITGDSIVFKQTVQDRLGKPFTKDVVKRILTPAV